MRGICRFAACPPPLRICPKKIGRTNVDELLYKAALAETMNELKKLRLGMLWRVAATKIGRHRVACLKGAEKEAYYRIPETERLVKKDILPGSITVSNIGSLYKEQKGGFALLEIVPPQVFAVGLGAVQEKPGVVILPDGSKEIGIRKVLPMCLVFDHRAVDFNALVPFLKRLDEIFASPGMIHALFSQ